MKTTICTLVLMFLPQLAWSQSDSYADLEKYITQLEKKAEVARQEAERLENKATDLDREVEVMHLRIQELEKLIARGENLYGQLVLLESEAQEKSMKFTSTSVRAMQLRIRHQQFSDAAQRARQLLKRSKEEKQQKEGPHSPFIPNGLQQE